MSTYRYWMRVILLGLIFSSPGACLQGEGDVCQVNKDCTGDLVCNPGTRRCQEPSGTIEDAGAELPAEFFDEAEFFEGQE